MQGVLQGVVQKAARDSTLESAQEETTQLAINQKIEDQVKRLAANADVSISRRNFYSYTKAAQAVAEPYNDNNGNDKCDDGEPFQDNNGNGVRDADGGSEGQGGTFDAAGIGDGYDRACTHVIDDGHGDRKSTRLKSSHKCAFRCASSA